MARKGPVVPRTDEEIFHAWRQYEARVGELVTKVGDDPLKALEYGLSVTVHDNGRNPEPQQAAVLRAAAELIIPEEFEWEVISAVGGACFLGLKAYRPEHE
jgi:hypothetical protein